MSYDSLMYHEHHKHPSGDTGNVANKYNVQCIKTRANESVRTSTAARLRHFNYKALIAAYHIDFISTNTAQFLTLCLRTNQLLYTTSTDRLLPALTTACARFSRHVMRMLVE